MDKNKLKKLGLSKFDKIEDNYYLGEITIKNYISLIKDKVKYMDEYIINAAKLKASEYNRNKAMKFLLIV